MIPGVLELRHGPLLVIYRSLVKQISPDKNMNFPCATASFTVAVRSHGFVVLDPKRFAGPALPTRLQSTPHMMFLFISSQFCVRLPPISSCPCWAHTRPGTIAQQVAMDQLHCVPLACAGSVNCQDCSKPLIWVSFADGHNFTNWPL